MLSGAAVFLWPLSAITHVLSRSKRILLLTNPTVSLYLSPLLTLNFVAICLTNTSISFPIPPDVLITAAVSVAFSTSLVLGPYSVFFSFWWDVYIAEILLFQLLWAWGLKILTSINARDKGDHKLIQLTSNLAPSLRLEPGGRFSPVDHFWVMDLCIRTFNPNKKSNDVNGTYKQLEHQTCLVLQLLIRTVYIIWIHSARDSLLARKILSYRARAVLFFVIL